jgi:hypothetical protein
VLGLKVCTTAAWHGRHLIDFVALGRELYGPLYGRALRAKAEFYFIPFLPFQKQRDYALDGESGKVSNLQYLHR